MKGKVFQGGAALLIGCCLWQAGCSPARTTQTTSTDTMQTTDANAAATDTGTMSQTKATADMINMPVPPPIPNLNPKGPDPAWGASIDDNMLVVIEQLQSYGAPPLTSLTPQQARQQPTPATAAMDVMKMNNLPMPPAMVDTLGRKIAVDGGQVHARIYRPKNTAAALPVIVYYHGGGWVIADIDTYDASARGLAEKTGAIVLSVHYRQAPEHKFPTAHNDAFAAYQWALNNAASFGGDPKKVAVAGESAGGNLACNVSIMARDRGVQMPMHQLLVYPIANSDMNNGSYVKYAEAKPLSKPLMEWFVMHYLNNRSEAADPRISLVNADLKNLPPTTLITAQIDPLHDEGRLLGDRLKAAGVDVRTENYEGVTHEFFGMDALLNEARKAQGLAAGNFRRAFGRK